MYGGLGRVGLDYGKEFSDEEFAEEKEKKEEVPAFSSSVVLPENVDDEELLAQDFDINDLDKAAFEVPNTDDGYLNILKERFGHTSFLAGQLDAIKILTAKRDNALVVLATGGGKSLIY
jgi:superfamily II DNA helicase RecQ